MSNFGIFSIHALRIRFRQERANKAKHGIDFEEAQALWDDEDRIVFPSIYPAEARHAVIGLVGGKLWAAIVTIRGASTRIISVRRARNVEVEAYFSRRAR